MKTFSLISVFLMWMMPGHAQTGSWESASAGEVSLAYQKACQWLINTPSYAFKIKYASFGDAITSVSQESSDGYYKRVANRYISEAAGIKTIQNLHMRVIIDTSDKIVTVMDPGNMKPGIATQEELEALLKNTRSLKKRKQAKVVRYRMEFNKNEQFDAYEFSVNEQGMLGGLTYYYSEQTEKEDGEWRLGGNREFKVKPRLEVSFSNYETPAKYKDSEFSEQGVISKEKEKIGLTSTYRNFRLLDYRIKK